MWHIPDGCLQMLWLFADELGRIHPEGLRQLADRASLGFRHVAGEGESYMGLFPRTIGKRFLRTRTDASWRTHPWPRLHGRGNGRKAYARVGSCRTLHLYPAPQDVVLTRMPSTGSRGPSSPHRARFMRDSGFGLRRTPLLRGWVNKAYRPNIRLPHPVRSPRRPPARLPLPVALAVLAAPGRVLLRLHRRSPPARTLQGKGRPAMPLSCFS